MKDKKMESSGKTESKQTLREEGKSWRKRDKEEKKEDLVHPLAIN